MESISKYRGQWGGKTDTGEEMWWSEPDLALASGTFLKRAKFYLDVRQFFLTRYLNRGISAAKKSGVKNPKVIDFGCGTGGTTLNFSSYIRHPIDGYDIFKTQIEIANEQAKKINNTSQFHLLTSEGKVPLPDASVDVLLSADVLGHVPSIPTTLKEWARVLKPGAAVSLFTESNYSASDQSLMARLARDGMDMSEAVPEHISLFPKEQLEVWFQTAGFEVVERISANAGHWFFFPKDYAILLAKHGKRPMLLAVSRIWNVITKLTPFYSWTFEIVRLGMTLLTGRSAPGSGYFYYLRKQA